MAVKALLWGALGLALICAGCIYRARIHEAAAEAAFPPEGQFVEVAGARVHAVVLGPEDAPAVVLIHGASGNTRDWTYRLAPELARSYRVIVLDRPGLGYTPRRDRRGDSITRQALLLQEAAARLGADRPVVVGHSYGGAVALAWAVNRPDTLSALVLLAAASHPWDTGLSTYYKVLSHPVVGPPAIALLTAFVPDARVKVEVAKVFTPDAVPPGYLDHFGAGLTLRRASLRANALQRANLLDEIIALVPQYPEIIVPAEIVHGTADTIVGAAIHSEPLSRAVPEARLTLLPGIGHMPHHAAPDEVSAAIHRAVARAGLRDSD
ncbi:MAG: alpha/beta hydrolase [Pseudomonadota bacterium]